MSKDRLFVLQSNFEDPKYPGTKFFCPHGNQIEGLLATNPQLANDIEVVRLPFPRPRQPVIDLIGEANQGLPVLILANDKPIPADAKDHNGTKFVSETKRILELLAERHGFPVTH